MNQTAYAVIFLSIFLLLVGMAHLLYRLLKFPAEQSRKFLHVSGGLLALSAPLFFLSHWPVLIICMSAFLFLLFTYIKQMLPAVHRTKRKSVGSVIFPIAVYFCFLIATKKNNDLLFYLPVSFLTISDTMAEWGGTKWGDQTIRLKNNKSMAGALSFAVCSIFIAIAWGMVYHLGTQQIMVMTAITTFAATLAELWSSDGWDNLTIPLVTVACILLMKFS
jgi:phytol kinase